VGDRTTDIGFGNNIGATCILVETGYGVKERATVLSLYSDVIFRTDLAAAIDWITFTNAQQ
jgi:phosphoglycolate phosphatase-like HAD superfamily hydrolase